MKYTLEERLDIGRRIYEGELKKRFPEHEMILHSDQGSVYSSKKYNELLPMYNVIRSMSRAGTLTDNAAMEAINGWIKAELFTDFHVTGDRDVALEVDEYIVFFNEQRPAYSCNLIEHQSIVQKDNAFTSSRLIWISSRYGGD